MSPGFPKGVAGYIKSRLRDTCAVLGNSNGYARDDLAGTWRILGEWLNLYATIVALGVLNLFGVAFANSLDVLSDPAVLGIVGFMYLVEFFADKTPGVDSVWDALHTLICGPAGALLVAGAVVDAGEPLIVAAALLGGSAVALRVVRQKANSRVIVNILPELVSNWIVLLLEDIIVIVGISLAVAKPVFFFALLGVFCLFTQFGSYRRSGGALSRYSRDFFQRKPVEAQKWKDRKAEDSTSITPKNRYLNKVLELCAGTPLSVAAFYRLEIDNNITALIRCALAPGRTRQVASYSSTIHGPDSGSVRSARWITGVSSQPVAGPK